MSTTERNYARQAFIDAWSKHTNKQLLSPLETLIVAIIEKHPEYIQLLESKESVAEDYRTDNNPFLHLGLHLSLEEQINTNRPHGIQDVYTTLCKTKQDSHAVEHLMMDVMGNILWEAQKQKSLPCETTYLETLKALI